MKKNFTPLLSTLRPNQPVIVSSEMNPSNETFRNILQFAAAYRVEKRTKDEYIEYFLN
ncbi:MAG: hypothetical protein ACK5KP_08975 [Paludibacteraceae bacterium]